ncbi:hypothetical protein JL720_14319 [Aureococcus anophagefferens]|nr:hypothetical protein JL720_14319 [Aureococcus anophagefferens]
MRLQILLASVPLATGLVARTAAPVSYLSEVEDADKKKKYWEEDGYNEYGDKNYDNLPSDPRARTSARPASGVPLNYDGFIDAEGFDGGDGQVGVIGDGKNAMEEYDMNQAVEGKEYQAINHGSYLAQFDKKPADMDIIAGNRDTFVADELVAGDAMGVLACKATLNGRGGTTLTIKNEFSTYDDFEFVIKFQPTAAPSYEAKLVIETESVKWTYDVVCQLE